MVAKFELVKLTIIFLRRLLVLTFDKRAFQPQLIARPITMWLLSKIPPLESHLEPNHASQGLSWADVSKYYGIRIIYKYYSKNKYLYSFSATNLNPNIIHIRIRLKFWVRIAHK